MKMRLALFALLLVAVIISMFDHQIVAGTCLCSGSGWTNADCSGINYAAGPWMFGAADAAECFIYYGCNGSGDYVNSCSFTY